MFAVLVSEIAKPASRRLGTALSAYLIGQGVATDTASMITAGAVAAFGLGLDLLVSAHSRGKLPW